MNKLASLYASLNDNITLEDYDDFDDDYYEDEESIEDDVIDLVQNDDDLEEMYDVEEGVNAIAEEMMAIIGRGKTLTFESAVMAHNAINAYLSRIGLSADSVIPSLESFNTNDNAELTEIAMENVLTTVTNISKKIYSGISNAIEATSIFFGKMFDKVGNYKKRIEYLKKKADTINWGSLKPGDAGATIKIKDPNLIMFKGSIKIDDIIDGLNSTKLCVTKWAPEYIKRLKVVFNEFSLVFVEMHKGSKNNFDEEKSLLGVEKIITDLWEVSYTNLMSGDKSLKTVKGQRFYGSRARTPADKNMRADMLAKIRLVKDHNRSKFTGNKVIPVPSGKEIHKLLDTAEALIDAIVDLKKELGKDGYIEKSRIEAGENAKKLVTGGKNNFIIRIGKNKYGKKLLGHVRKDYTTPLSQLVGHGMAVSGTAINIASMSIKKYKSSIKDFNKPKKAYKRNAKPEVPDTSVKDGD